MNTTVTNENSETRWGRRRKFPYIAASLVCMVMLAVQRPGRSSEAEESRPWEQVYLEQSKQFQADDIIARDAGARWGLVMSLSRVVQNDDFAAKSPSQVLFAIERLARLQAIEAVPSLVHRIEFHGNQPPPTASLIKIFPVFDCLLRLLRYDKQETASLLVEELARGGYSPMAQNHIVYILGRGVAPSNALLRNFLANHRDEYKQRSLRLKEMARVLDGDNPVEPLPAVEQGISPALVPAEGAIDQNPKWERASELMSLILNDDLTMRDEDRVIAAITELGQLNIAEAAPVLMDKLEFAAGEGQDGGETTRVNTFSKGLRSPAIAQAALRAVQLMGHSALPSLIFAVSKPKSSARYRETVLGVIVQIAGSKQSARRELLDEADLNAIKAERIATLITTMRQ